MAAATEQITEPSTAGVGTKLQRRIAFHLARRPYNGFPSSSGDFCLETLNPKNSDSIKATLGTAKMEAVAKGKGSTDGEFYDHGFDPELGFRITFRKIGAGLANLGNTCYLNSVLQCLTYTEPFAAYLQSGKHKSTCRAAGFCAMCALQNHVMDALQSTGKILRPFQLVKNLRCISRNFSNSRQEDAHEYMVHLLESMHKCCLPYGVPSESPSAYEKSQVHKIFGGQLRSQVKCMQCSFCSNKFDPFLDLSLEIVKADSVSKALANFSAVELLDGGERQYHCQRCKEKVKALKQLTIHKAPYVLTIHLKRFGSSIHCEKISKKVEYGPTLDLKPFISDPHGGDHKYDLYGVLVHAGWTTRSGHYFCYVRTSAGMWYSLDDNQVTQVSEKTVLSREAYMLFYVRNQSFAIKSSIESAPKPNSSANVVGINKEITSIERKFTAVYSSTKTKLDNNHSELTTKGSCSNVTVCLSNNGKQIAELQDIAERPKDSKPPSIGDQKDKSMEKNVLVSHSPHWMEVGHPLARVVHEEDLRLSKTTSDSIQKKAPCKVPDYGRENLREFENCSKNLEYLNLLETKPFNSMQLCTTTSSAQREYFSNKVAQRLLGSEKEDEAKSKKLKKFSLAKGSFFGCKRLLFMSLYQQKKNRMGSKKRYQNSRNRTRKKVLYHSITSSSEPSTSQTSQGVDIGSEHLSGKHAHSAACRKLKRKEGAKLGCSSVHFEERNSTNMAVQDASDQLCGHSYSRMESIVKQELSKDVVIQNFSANLLMTSLKETPVARWDDKNLMTHPVDETEYNPKRNIGYVVDEWDEEYDRGKRKKVKNSRQWPDAGDPNPFQETANFMARKKMKAAVERKRSENLPFRI